MRKTFSILLLTMILFIPVMVFKGTEASQGGALLRENKKMMMQLSSTSTIDYLKDIVVVPDDSFEEEEVLHMINRISKIHPSILEKVVSHNVRLKLFTGTLTDQPGFTHLKGVKPRGYVRNTWDDVPGAGGSSLVLAKIGHSHKGKGHGSVNLELHELAHSIDKLVFNSIRDDATFIKIWKEEAPLLFPAQPYFINHSEEYFAESFAMYNLSFFTSSDLFIRAPKTYEYIKNLESQPNQGIELAVSFR
ncbi:anthrax toxin lethal factor-related metalloendopeptidase [Bacillus suaedaesalsae]|uniref:Toxin n=1 Tax=Bacillus suaedaesalsae TaxID=2810349 RepID=A0ABS2DLP5_9BACI|nr:toxin [Bacillus suaedaesalsae]MBM6619351.1 toxin [Bacillus suaedaesalsae]